MLGHGTELDQQVAGEVFRLDLAPLFLASAGGCRERNPFSIILDNIWANGRAGLLLPDFENGHAPSSAAQRMLSTNRRRSSSSAVRSVSALPPERIGDGLARLRARVAGESANSPRTVDWKGVALQQS